MSRSIPIESLIPLRIKALQCSSYDGITNHSRVGRIVRDVIRFIAFLQVAQFRYGSAQRLKIDFKIMTSHATSP